MGLRERNAQRAREVIAESALLLFEEHGYEGTTLEDVAERAGVSVSTLYRYFSTKDSLLLEHPRIGTGVLADLLRDQPADLQTADALGAATVRYLDRVDASRDFIQRVSAMIETVPSARAGIRNHWQREANALAVAVGERTGRATDALDTVLTAHLTMTLVALAVEAVRADADATARDVGAELMLALADPARRSEIIPVLPDGERD